MADVLTKPLSKHVWILTKKIFEMCFCGSDWLCINTGSGNALEPNTRQAINWT